MAEQGSIFQAVREAITVKIYGIEPEALTKPEIKARWKEYKPDETARNEFEDSTGKTRLFRVGEFQRLALTIGCTSRRYDFTGTIKIGYPRGELYMDAANSDADKIARALDGDPITVAGCDFVVVNEQLEILFEIDNEEPWQWVTLPLVGVIETTA